MVLSPEQALQVVPAQLSFLTIYNPSLGKKNKTIAEQIVFYASRPRSDDRAGKGKFQDAEDVSQEEENEQLRQVGLAQAMVSFANNFSERQAINTIETEKSRIVLCELEADWWILGSIDLTKLPSSRKSGTEKRSGEDLFEFSSRELAPADLIIQQLRRAHACFLLHHGASLESLYGQMARNSFCKMLGRYWTQFAFNWEPLLHGNPAVDLYGGIKLAGGAELGVGVGEEEWGSGEREVLEDFMSRTNGLQDLVVSRFGSAPVETTDLDKDQPSRHRATRETRWLGTEADPCPSDGVIFSGVGAIAKESIASLSHWAEDVYRYGNKAYGIRSYPSSKPRKKAPRSPSAASQSVRGSISPRHRSRSSHGRPQSSSPGVPPPLVRVVEQSLREETTNKDSKNSSTSPERKTEVVQEGQQEASALGAEKMMKYLSLGYGSAWTLNPRGFPKSDEQASRPKTSGLQSASDPRGSEPSRKSPDELPPKLDLIEPSPEISDEEETPFIQHVESSIGSFLIGLLGDLENQDLHDEDTDSQAPITNRSVTVQTKSNSTPTTLNLVIYTHQPFIFIFLFSPDTPALSAPSFYRSIHHHLGALQKPLLRSTSPTTAAARIAQATAQNPQSQTTSPIFSLLYNPTTHSTLSDIPNIPAPPKFNPQPRPITVSGAWYTLGIPTGSSTSPAPAPSASSTSPSDPLPHTWSRPEALAAHTQILNTWQAARSGGGGGSGKGERERMSKNGRGWWVLWVRIPNTSQAGEPEKEKEKEKEKEVVLVREARDGGGGQRKVGRGGNRWLGRERGGMGMGMAAGSGGVGGVAGMSEGVGVDAARWVEGLAGLSR